MDFNRPPGHWGGHSLRNGFCYNSRLSRDQFWKLLHHYCHGTPALHAAIAISNERRKISRQTVSKYYQQIGLVIFRSREIFRRFTWWPDRMWPDGWDRCAINYQQLMELRKDILYGVKHQKNEMKRTNRGPWSWQPTDRLLFVRILREMSLKMNGISKSTFEAHLGRACLLASFLSIGHANLKRDAAEKEIARAQGEMRDFLLTYFEKNPWLWSVKMSARRQETYWTHNFYVREVSMIEVDDARQRWTASAKVSSNESTLWKERRLLAMYDDTVDLSNDPHTLTLDLGWLLRTTRRPSAKRSRKKSTKR